MRVPRFYCPELSDSQQHIELPDSVHRHAVQVLRLKPGAEIRLFDGKGHEVLATLSEVNKRQSLALIGATIQTQLESPLTITLLQGISRGERMDYAIQKAVELGVNRIVPVVTERCNVQLAGERADKRLKHWQGVVISACEQSGRNQLPELTDVMQLEEALTEITLDCRLVLDPEAETSLAKLSPATELALLIGPEGGLSESEVALAVDRGYNATRFGPRVLRTETASAAALAVVQALWGDLL